MTASQSIRVVKIGGRPQGDPSLAARLAAAWRATPGALVVVHGGGDEITALQKAFDVTPRFVGGRRVTSAQDIDTLRMALSGAANKRIVARVRAEGIDAIGLSGEDAGLLVSHAMNAELYGLVGEPRSVNVRLLGQLLGAGLLPILSPVSASDTPGEALNVNGDDAASAIASALGARDLLLVADVPGVLVDGDVVPVLRRSEAEALVASGVAAGGMGAKVQAALAALARGVARVRIGDLAAIEDISRGTTFLADDALAASGQGATIHPSHRRSVA